MLIQMGNARLANLLIQAAHRKSDVDRDDRRLMSLDHEHCQAVRKFMFDHTLGQTLRPGIQQSKVVAKTEYQ